MCFNDNFLLRGLCSSGGRGGVMSAVCRCVDPLFLGRPVCACLAAVGRFFAVGGMIGVVATRGVAWLVVMLVLAWA